MRLTIINQFYTPDISPTAHLSATLAEHRAAAGDEVRIITSWGGYVPSAEQKTHDHTTNPHVHRLWTPRLGKASSLRRIIDYASFYLLAAWRLVTLPKQDVIIALTTPPFIVLAAVMHKFLHPRTRIVLWSMDCYPEAPERAGMIRQGAILSRIMRTINRFIYRRLSHLVTLDSAMTNLLAAYHPARKPVPTTVIPNWEKLAFFPPDIQPPPWDQVEPLALKDKFVVLYLGNTGYGHRFDAVIDAAKQLHDDNIVFLFVGGGKRWDHIAAEVKREKLNNILMRGYIPKDQTPSVMAAADVALITLGDEALGVMSPSKLHANLAMGLPIFYIGPATSNVDDAIARFHCGFSFRHDQGNPLANELRQLSQNPDQHAQLRNQARQAFEQAYCDQQTLQQFDRVIATLT